MQADIVDGLRAAGCLVWVIGRPVDLLAWRPGGTVVPLEVKAPGREKRLRPTQRVFMETAVAFTVSTAEEAIRLVRRHSRVST